MPYLSSEQPPVPEQDEHTQVNYGSNYYVDMLLLPNPANPIRAVPNGQIAARSGTGEAADFVAELAAGFVIDSFFSASFLSVVFLSTMLKVAFGASIHNF